MAIISRLGVVLGLDSAEFNAGLGKAEAGMNKFKGSSALVASGLAAAGAAFVATSYQAIQFADSINDIAKANEMAVGTVLEFSQALSTNGGKAEDAAKLLSTFTNKIDEAATGSQKTRDKFHQLGVSLSDLGKLSETDLLRKTIDGLARIEDPITRNAIAFDLLGKAAKNVDIKGLNEEFARIKGSMDGADKSFSAIGNSLDRIDRLSQQIKIDMAKNLSTPFQIAATAAEKFYEFLKEQKQSYDAFVKKTGFGLADALIPGLATAKQDLKLLQILRGGKSGGSNVYSPSTDTAEYKPNFDVAKTSSIGRKIEQTPEQIAAAKKAKLAAEKELADAAKDTAQWAIKREQEERTAREARAKEVVQMVIKQHETYQTTMKQAQLDKERLEYQKTLVNMSDTQRDKALALFDIEKEMVQIQKQNPAFSPEMLERIKEAKTEAVIAQEELTRAQNTFQAGWNRAYENFAEKAKDSASVGAHAFESMASSMESALDNFVRTGKLSFSDLINSMISDLLRMMLKAQATSLFGSVIESFGGIFGGGGGVSSSAGAYSIDNNPFIGAYADGGNPPVGVPSLVGERGAELFVPRTAGTIIPNHSLSAMMGSQPQTVYNGTVIQNMNAIDTQSATQFLTKNKQAVWSANQSAQRGLPMSR